LSHHRSQRGSSRVRATENRESSRGESLVTRVTLSLIVNTKSYRWYFARIFTKSKILDPRLLHQWLGLRAWCLQVRRV